MDKLADAHPYVFQFFMKGHHILRRSDRYWADLSADLVIEQVLMRSLKTSCGLTRGRGMTEIQRLIWLMTMPQCSEVNAQMQFLTSVSYETSEQHKEMSKSRQEKDTQDTFEMISYLLQRNPFQMINACVMCLLVLLLTAVFMMLHI